MPTSSIVLATYNGARFLGEFLESLVAQTDGDFEVIVSDDGSTDHTIAIARSFSDRLDLKISQNDRNLGPSRNFSCAAERASGRFVLFADQDDVWHYEKVAEMSSALQQSEDQPTLVFSDIEIVDAGLNLLAASFFSGAKSSACWSLEDFIISGHIPGCSMALNRSLLDLSLPVPEGFRMHDWWISMVAATKGSIRFLPTPMVKYRQHDNNTYGAPRAQNKGVSDLAKSPIGAMRRKFAALKGQADYCRKNIVLFNDRFRSSLSPRDQQTIEAFTNFRPLTRMKIMNKAQLGQKRNEAMIIGMMI